MEFQKKNMDELFRDLERMNSSVNPIRDTLIDKLTISISKMEIDLENDNPERLEFKLEAINKLDSLLKSKADNNHRSMNMYFKDKESTNEDKLVAAQVDALISKLDFRTTRINNDNPVDMDEEKNKLDLVFEESGDVIKETELREDSKDLEEKE